MLIMVAVTGGFQCFGRTYRLLVTQCGYQLLQTRIVSIFAVNMVSIYQTTQRQNPEDH
jgi:hypothetical protein